MAVNAQGKGDSVGRLDELYFRLRRIEGVQNPIAILVFFYALTSKAPANERKANRLDLMYMKKQYAVDCPSTSAANKNGGSVETLNNIMYQTGAAVQMRRDSHTSRAARPHTVHMCVSPTPSSLQDYDIPLKDTELKKQLVSELAFALQGMDCKLLQHSTSKRDSKYTIKTDQKVDGALVGRMLRTAEIGNLYSRISKYCQRLSRDKSLGYISQSFEGALSEELVSYSRLITMIEQKNRLENEYGGGHFAYKIHVQLLDSTKILRSLDTLIDQCSRERTGSLINVVYRNLQHGDPLIRALMNRIMTYIVLPLRKMLSAWIFYGELNDTYREFFICSSKSNSLALTPMATDSVWHEKYTINESKLPTFISKEQAKQILTTGKAVNLLKHLGTSDTEITSFEQLKQSFERVSVEKLFNTFGSVQDSEFVKLLNLTYKETSSKALQILNDNFHFTHHLKGMRQFLLLSQGDFIQHLMDKLAPVLNKPANQLRTHNLNSMFVNAIRSTNAEYMIPDVIERLDVVFIDSESGTGWDAFTLTYQTQGAISTVFTQKCMEKYTQLFRYLWKSKRMEYILSCLWKNLVFCSRASGNMKQLRNILQFVNIIQSEMIHFVQQMQYYIRFEVLECCWAVLEKKVEAAEDIDQLVEAQRQFFKEVTLRLMFGEKVLTTQLCAIYDTIINFESVVNSLLAKAELERLRREQFDARKSTVTTETETNDRDEFEKRRRFEDITLGDFKIKLQSLSGTYETMVHKYLLLLADQCDTELRSLSVRLDYNGHYSRRNKSLETSFTYFRQQELESSRIIDSI
jgi:gamma-tubulin complex component 3